MNFDQASSTSLLETASSYILSGLHVLPIHAPVQSLGLKDAACSCKKSGCRAIGKHPATRRGHLDAICQLNELPNAFPSDALRNIGIATGKRSGIIVVDIDDLKGGSDTIAHLKQKGLVLESRLRVKTGHGQHLYFAMPSVDIRNSCGILGKGIDIRSDGGLVVAPPSVHVSGARYAWIGDVAFARENLQQLPDWLFDRLTQPRARTSLTAKVREGSRNTYLVSEAGKLRRSGMSSDGIVSALLALNRDNCDPLLEKDEVRSIARSIAKYPVGPRSRNNTKSQAALPARDENQAPRSGRREAPVVELQSWEEPVDGAETLDEVARRLMAHMCISPEAASAASLWALFSHAHNLFETSPILAVLSPEKRCGKTTFLSCMRLLVPRPLPTSNVTTAALFRSIDRWAPTLLIDEGDTFLHENDDMRGILNSGHKRDFAAVWRTSGETHEPKKFLTWTPKIIAQIGLLPETVEDRAVVISLQRKRLKETVEPLNAHAKNDLAELAQKLARWVEDNAESIREKEASQLVGMNDRANDNWSPLLILADCVGTRWPEAARSAAHHLERTQERGREGSDAEALLQDIFQYFKEHSGPHAFSRELASYLASMDHRPWAAFRSYRPITVRQVAQILRPFGIAPRTLRVSPNETLKGYHREDFEDAFSRYLKP